MSLSFLVPAFFAGLLALAIPVLIHLSRRDTRNPEHFPSFMFLDKVPQNRTEKRRIHRWPLFILRSLAIALLVLAFARPFLAGNEDSPAGATGGDREVVVLLDRSYSMDAGDRWQRATSAAEEVISGLSGGDRGTVILFDTGAETASESTNDRGVLRTAIRDARPGSRKTRYAPALRYAARVLSASPLPRQELVVISDFQRGGWDADGGETSSLRLPAGTLISTVNVVNDGDTGVNIAVTGADFDRQVVTERERVTVTARFASNGGVTGDIPVSLEINGRPVETLSLNFGEGNSGSISFSAITLPETGVTRGTVRIPNDLLAADNVFNFVLSSDQRIPVLIMESGTSRTGGSYFLERALSVSGTPGFKPEVRRGGEIRPMDLASNPVVILNQAPFPGGASGERLRQYVEQGGGVVMVLGDAQPGDWSGVLPSIPAPVDRMRDGGTTLGYVDMGHPVFEAFAGPRSGDFGSPRFYRYRPFPSESFPRVLARFGDGGVALAERSIGDGKLLIWTSTLDTDWNDLTLHPVFLPFLHQLTRYAAGHAPPPSWHTIGDPLDVRGFLRADQRSAIAVTPRDQQVEVDTGTPLELTETGFYELRDARGGQQLAAYAVNVDISESELSSFDPEEMQTALVAAAQAAPSSSELSGLSITERERIQGGWWYLILGVFTLLLAETFFSNRGAAGRDALMDRWRSFRRGSLAG
ncbi:MAG: BatA and WFA domain-containing protein [Gemmatimonadota bacterium]|jgi:hypothetical protein|nr:BatA and WFA domain-containing protein [Gemmatimonadota bacterium]